MTEPALMASVSRRAALTLGAGAAAGAAYARESPAELVFDSHFHVIDPAFPLVLNQGYIPPSFSLADYRAAVGPFGVKGGALVSGSFQGFDQTYLLAALARMVMCGSLRQSAKRGRNSDAPHADPA